MSRRRQRRKCVPKGGVCRGVVADVGDPRQAEGIIEETLAELGRVDILVNAAGIIRPGSILDLELDDWDATLRVHLAGTLNTSRAALAHWASIEGGGRRLRQLLIRRRALR